jgi:hypothetical protein
MKYTSSAIGDKKVEQDMKIICEEILSRIKDTETIILTGGFSRGEGPVKTEKGKTFPYNDYDIQVISKTNLTKEETDKISVEISEKLGYKGIVNFYPFKKEEQKMKGNFYIDMKCDTQIDLKKMLPRIRTYELKNNSMILYGKDTRNIIPHYNLKDIPLSEGAKLLLDRMSQMIEYYSTEKKHEKEFLAYIIQQAYAACCTSLLLLSRKYEIGYGKSMEILKRTYEEDFPELSKKIPDLTKKIEQFVKWKINPKKLPSKNIEIEWFIAKENIIEVSRYFFSRFLNERIETLEDLSKAILRMRRRFYLPYLKEMVKKRIGISIGAGFLLPFVTKVMKRKYNNRLKEMKINFKFKKSFSPDLIIFSSLVFLIGAITKERIDLDMLNKGKYLLREVYPAKGENWEEASVDYANAYIAFFLQKI